MTRTPHSPRAIDALAYPDALERAEARLVAERRRAVDPSWQPADADRLPHDTVGVGLSGGGVRSATFALGVFQALARARCLERVDFLSTVSGGGYFGSFLGRLFSRPWVTDIECVRRVLEADEPHPQAPAGADAWSARVFRWLRDNGRYLAPRGSGDLLLVGSLLLRNWVAVQTVLIVTMLTAFAYLQFGRILIERALIASSSAIDTTSWLIASMPFFESLLWWSPWIVTPIVPFALVAAPAGWAYWLVSRDDDGILGIPAWIGAVFTLLLAAGGIVHYAPAPASHPWRFGICLVVGSLAFMALVFYVVGEVWVRRIRPQHGASPAETGNRLRTGLTRWLKTGLTCFGVLLVVALLDSVGGSIYVVSEEGTLTRWFSGMGAVFAGLGAFARPLFLLFGRDSRSDRPGLKMSTVTWLVAVLLLAVWLLGINVASHALRWGFDEPAGPPPPELPPFPPFLIWSTIVLSIFTWLFGQTRRFANLSSVHGFYTARLTRTFLGASNEARLHRRSSAVSETTRGDDCASDQYWIWPARKGTAPADAHSHRHQRPWQKGGPLHLINTTVNETVDARSGIQNQDRKGIGLAVGPTAVSLGVRHHLVASHDSGSDWQVFPSDPLAHKVFKADSETPPERLSLGRWMSVSGAAFSAAAGANTTVPLAILCGMFNVRLGYWWNSGTGYGKRWFEKLLPVQSAFFDEMFARTHGTAGQLWNISDGGHFENMAGYELIRRRLQVIVIVDAEADPDYTFQGLSDLVRKARLDFRAEIVFLNTDELNGPESDEAWQKAPGAVPPSVRPYFGDLDALRRGKWDAEDYRNARGAVDRRFALEVDRTRPSKAHAAMARVIYGDPDGSGEVQRSWLVYVKATLMGDEPEDVCHYHRGHVDFPQETTLDQFFDEAQWESYRRLGQHVGHRVLTPELFEHLKHVEP